MKSFHIVLMIILLSFPCAGQNDWVLDSEAPFDIKVFKSNVFCENFLSIKSLDPFNIPIAFVFNQSQQVKLSLSGGAPIWENTYIMDIPDLAWTSDYYYFSTILFGTDAGGNSSTIPYSYRKDPASGAEEWLQLPSDGLNGFRVEGLSDDEAVFFDTQTSRIVTTTPSGEINWSNVMNFPFNDVSTQDHNSRLVVAKQNGGLVSYYPNGIYYNGNANNGVYEKIKALENNRFVALRNDTLFRLSELYAASTSYGFPVGQVRDYAVNQTQTAVLTNSGQVHVLDQFLQLEHSFSPAEESEIQFVGICPAWVTLAGQETYGPNMPGGGTKVPFFKVFAFSGENFGLGSDVGVVEILPGPSHVFSQGNYYVVEHAYLSVKVRNFGTGPVKELYLNHRSLSPYQSIRKKFEGLNIQPGETATLSWDNFSLRTFVAPTGVDEICIWTSHPDFHLDANSTNDGLCTDFPVNDREPEAGFVFSVFPNPSTSATTIEYAMPPGHGARLRVFNSMGILVAEQDAPAGGSQVALPKFPAGLYFVSLEVEGAGTRTLKLVQL